MHNMPKPNEVTSIHAQYLDCCLADFFQGSDADEVLAVPVWANITYREAYETAKDEFHRGSGYFDEVAGSGGMAEDALHALFAYMLPERSDEVADFAKYIEPVDDDDESAETVFLYIGLYAETDSE